MQLFARPFTGFVLMLALLWAAAAHAAAPAGEVREVSGTVTAQAPGEAARRLQRGDTIRAGDRLSTAKRASVYVQFTDGGRLQLGAQSEFELAEYAWTDQAVAFTARVGKGVFRMVSGLIARRDRERYRAELPVVTIGIRGTDFAGEVRGDSARIVLLESEDGAPSAIEVWNAFGRVVIDAPGFGTEVPDAHSPPSAPRRMRLDGVTNLMRTIGQIQRLQTPRLPPR